MLYSSGGRGDDTLPTPPCLWLLTLIQPKAHAPLLQGDDTVVVAVTLLQEGSGAVFQGLEWSRDGQQLIMCDRSVKKNNR